MAMGKCRECGAAVSSAAKVCPSCGIAKPVASPSMSGTAVLGISAGCLLVLGLCYAAGRSGADATSATTEPQITVGGTITIAPHSIGCKTKESFQKLFSLRADKQAGTLYLINPANGCAVLNGGVVNVEDRAVLDALIQVRAQGDPQSYWTSTAEISRPTP